MGGAFKSASNTAAELEVTPVVNRLRAAYGTDIAVRSKPYESKAGFEYFYHGSTVQRWLAYPSDILNGLNLNSGSSFKLDFGTGFYTFREGDYSYAGNSNASSSAVRMGASSAGGFVIQCEALKITYDRLSKLVMGLGDLIQWKAITQTFNPLSLDSDVDPDKLDLILHISYGAIIGPVSNRQNLKEWVPDTTYPMQTVFKASGVYILKPIAVIPVSSI